MGCSSIGNVGAVPGMVVVRGWGGNGWGFI